MYFYTHERKKDSKLKAGKIYMINEKLVLSENMTGTMMGLKFIS